MTTISRPSFIQRALPALSALALAGLLAGPLAAQQGQSAAAAATFGGDFLSIYERVESRYLDLAEAIPADRYTWRPADGVRSVSEVLMHVAQVNFGSARSVGATPPSDLPTDLSTVTEKGRVIEILRQSFQLAGGAAKALASSDFSQPAPGVNMTMGGAMLSYAEHQGEHLGQLVAYARGLGVTPPWSR